MKKKFWGVGVLLLAVVFMAAVGGCGGGDGDRADYEVSTQVFPLTRNGVTLHLERYETDEPGDKTPLLMVHGLTYSSHEFDVDYEDYSLARFFAREGYAVWLLDIAGYGRSGKNIANGYVPDSDYAAEDIKAAADLIVRESGTDKLNVLGWSWGTVTSGRFAAKSPELVDKLVLYAPILAGPGIIGQGMTEVSFDEEYSDYNLNTWDGAMGDFQPIGSNIISYDIVELPVAEKFASNCWRYDGEKSPNGGRRDLLCSTELLIPTEQIEAPTLLIAGDKDPLVFSDLVNQALDTLPEGSEREIVPGAAHAMLMEKPYYKEFREAVLDFLKK